MKSIPLARVQGVTMEEAVALLEESAAMMKIYHQTLLIERTRKRKPVEGSIKPPIPTISTLNSATQKTESATSYAFPAPLTIKMRVSPGSFAEEETENSSKDIDSNTQSHAIDAPSCEEKSVSLSGPSASTGLNVSTHVSVETPPADRAVNQVETAVVNLQKIATRVLPPISFQEVAESNNIAAADIADSDGVVAANNVLRTLHNGQLSFHSSGSSSSSGLNGDRIVHVLRPLFSPIKIDTDNTVAKLLLGVRVSKAIEDFPLNYPKVNLLRRLAGFFGVIVGQLSLFEVVPAWLSFMTLLSIPGVVLNSCIRLNVDIAKRLLKSFQFLYISYNITGLTLGFVLLLRDSRMITMVLLWLPFVTTFCMDAMPQSLRRFYGSSLMAMAIIWVLILLWSVCDNRFFVDPYFTAELGGTSYELPVSLYIIGCLQNIFVFCFRNLIYGLIYPGYMVVLKARIQVDPMPYKDAKVFLASHVIEDAPVAPVQQVSDPMDEEYSSTLDVLESSYEALQGKFEYVISEAKGAIERNDSSRRTKRFLIEEALALVDAVNEFQCLCDGDSNSILPTPSTIIRKDSKKPSLKKMDTVNNLAAKIVVMTRAASDNEGIQNEPVILLRATESLMEIDYSRDSVLHRVVSLFAPGAIFDESSTPIYETTLMLMLVRISSILSLVGTVLGCLAFLNFFPTYYCWFILCNSVHMIFSRFIFINIQIGRRKLQSFDCRFCLYNIIGCYATVVYMVYNDSTRTTCAILMALSNILALFNGALPLTIKRASAVANLFTDIVIAVFLLLGVVIFGWIQAERTYVVHLGSVDMPAASYVGTCLQNILLYLLRSIFLEIYYPHACSLLQSKVGIENVSAARANLLIAANSIQNKFQK